MKTPQCRGRNVRASWKSASAHHHCDQTNLWKKIHAAEAKKNGRSWRQQLPQELRQQNASVRCWCHC